MRLADVDTKHPLIEAICVQMSEMSDLSNRSPFCMKFAIARDIGNTFGIRAYTTFIGVMTLPYARLVIQ